MKRVLSLLVALSLGFCAMAQTAPPLKPRSTDQFTQVDPYLAVTKGLGIPSGATNTLTGTGNRVNLFYNTTEHKLKIHDGVEWKDASPADLSNFYTKADVDALFSAIPVITASNGLTKTGNNIALGGDYLGGLTIGNPSGSSSYLQMNPGGVTIANLVNPNYSPKLFLSGGSGLLGWSNPTNSKRTHLAFDQFSTVFLDENFNRGIRYASDYSANFDERTLVDKGYTDYAISNAIGNIDLSNYVDLNNEQTISSVKHWNGTGYFNSGIELPNGQQLVATAPFADGPKAMINWGGIKMFADNSLEVGSTMFPNYFQFRQGGAFDLNLSPPTLTATRSQSWQDEDGVIALTKNFGAGQTIGANTTGSADKLGGLSASSYALNSDLAGKANLSGGNTFSGNQIFSGSVGIGTSSPSEALEVVGNIKTDSFITANSGFKSQASNNLMSLDASSFTMINFSNGKVTQFSPEKIGTGQLDLVNIFTGSIKANSITGSRIWQMPDNSGKVSLTSHPYKTVSDNYAIEDGDHTVIANTAGHEVTITLPNPSTVDGQIFYIKKKGSSNQLTVDCGSYLADGSPSLTMYSDNETYCIQATGSTYQVLTYFKPIEP